MFSEDRELPSEDDACGCECIDVVYVIEVCLERGRREADEGDAEDGETCLRVGHSGSSIAALRSKDGGV